MFFRRIFILFMNNWLTFWMYLVNTAQKNIHSWKLEQTMLTLLSDWAVENTTKTGSLLLKQFTIVLSSKSSSSSWFLPWPKPVSFSTSSVYPVLRLSFHLFRGLPLLLFPTDNFSLAILTILLSSILLIWLFHSCLRLYTQSLIFSILQASLIFSLFSV